MRWSELAAEWERWIRRNYRLALLGFASLCLLLFCVFGLIRYVRDARRSAEEQQAFQMIYYSETQPQESEQRAAVMRQYTVTIPRPEPAAAALPSATPVVKNWPGNPYRLVSPSFKKLQRRNRDIIGWLTIPDMLDQAVVQRDNSYYLKRDYLGYHNANGALFLEEGISLESRPDTYIIFGHNMKTGDMFGSLRLYENVNYYRQHAVIDFNVLYEDGRYAVFAVADVGTIHGLARYVPFMQLPGMEREARNRCLQQLKACSRLYIPVDVNADDQLLLLVTCDGGDDTRRVVAGRRLREGETEQDIARTAMGAQKR